MARDREKQSEFEQSAEQVPDDEVVIEEAEDTEEPAFEQPHCPRCGWHNTRPSHTSNILDMAVRVFGLRPFRCRSCGNRFRTIRRRRKSDD